MDKLILENFRTYKNRTEIDFAPITILTGKNNSGKSTILKAILLLSDYLNSDNQLELIFDGPLALKHKIDCMDNALTWNSSFKAFELSFEKEGFNFSFFFGSNGKNGLLQEAVFYHLSTKSKIKIERLSLNELSFEVDESFLDSFNYKNTKRIETEVENLTKTLVQYESEQSELEEKIGFEETGSKNYVFFTDQKNQLSERIKIVQKRISEYKQELKLRTRAKTLVFKQTFSLEEENGYSLTIISLTRRFLSKYFNSEEFKKKFGAVDQNQTRNVLFNFPERLNSALTFIAHHLGPNRTHQARLYLNQNRNMEINEIMADYAHRTPPEGSAAIRFLLKWMDIFEIGSDLRVRDVQATAAYLEIFNQNRWQNLTDKGFGAGQVLTILMKICNEINGADIQRYSFRRAMRFAPIIMIEEPETNLHPYLQSRLSEMFYDAFKQFGIRFILETHSEYLIRKTQTIINKTNDLEAFKVYYIDNSKGIQEMRYRQDGKFMDEFGPGFFDESANLAFELF